MRSYTHLTLEQRYQIQALMKMGHSYQEIGDVIGVHKSTITREVRRNQGRRGYRPQQAHRFTLSSATHQNSPAYCRCHVALRQ